MHIEFVVNGTQHAVEAAAGETLLPVLRRLGYWSVKHGCETGDCGACLVLVEGEPLLACLLPAARAGSKRITTVEGLGDIESLHPLQREFLAHGAVQCGYCTPAMLLAAAALLQRNPRPSEADVREALAGILCRCTGYVKPVEAVQAAAGDAAPPAGGV
jgi:putative selenate reductase molybdopterin-binding subunit